MTEDEINRLATELWKRMEPFAQAELERLFTNYMSTRTLLEPELVKKLFDAMQKDLQRFVQAQFAELRIKRLKQEEAMQKHLAEWDFRKKRP